MSPRFEWLRREDKTPARNLVVDFTSTLCPNLINDLNLVRSHNRIMQFSGAPWSNYQAIYDIKDNLTWIKGAHSIKTGFDNAYEIKFEPTNTNVFGDFTFDGKVTGDAFADLILGRAAQYSETDTVAFNDNRRNAFEAYVDDNWKVSRRLTLNIGVRYSYFPPAHEFSDKYRVVHPANYNPAKAVTLNAQGQIIKNSGDLFNGLVNPADYWDFSKKNFAPRGRLGQMLLQLNDTASAWQALSAGIAQNPRDVDTMLALGVAAGQRGQLAESIRWFTRATEVRPELPLAWLNLAVSHEQSGDFTLAESAYREAIRWQPDFAAAHDHLANLLAAKGDAAQARCEKSLAQR